LNFGISIAAICKQKPFTKNVNSPKVRKLMGNEINKSTGRMKLFTKASTKAARSEYKKSSM
jgi:hypothetical protein